MRPGFVASEAYIYPVHKVIPKRIRGMKTIAGI